MTGFRENCFNINYQQTTLNGVNKSNFTISQIDFTPDNFNFMNVVLYS